MAPFHQTLSFILKLCLFKLILNLGYSSTFIHSRTCCICSLDYGKRSISGASTILTKLSIEWGDSPPFSLLCSRSYTQSTFPLALHLNQLESACIFHSFIYRHRHVPVVHYHYTLQHVYSARVPCTVTIGLEQTPLQAKNVSKTQAAYQVLSPNEYKTLPTQPVTRMQTFCVSSVRDTVEARI